MKINRGLFFIALFVPLFFIASCEQYGKFIYPHQEKNLRQQFSENFETLSKLEKMQLDDKKMMFIRPDWTELTPTPELDAKDSNRWSRVDERSSSKAFVGLTKQRWDEYNRLFEQAGLEYGITGSFNAEDSSRMVEFLVDINEGFVYVENMKVISFNSIYECAVSGYKSRCYVPLRKNWYLFFGPF
jgi:hypothetical protein